MLRVFRASQLKTVKATIANVTEKKVEQKGKRKALKSG